MFAVMHAMAARDGAAATRWVQTMRRYAVVTRQSRYEAVAARLASAVAAGAPVSEVPRLVWVASP